MRAKSITEKNITPTVVCTAPWRVTKVKPLSDYKLHVEFLDGTIGIVDLSEIIKSEKAGVFGTLKNVKVFDKVFVEYGAVTWPGEIDLAPDAMHDEIKQHGKYVFSKL